MSRHALLLALWLTALGAAGPGAQAQVPAVETAQGDLSQLGDAGSLPGSLEQLHDLELTDAQARQAFEESLDLLLNEYRGGEVSEADLYLGALAGMVEALNWSEGQNASVPRASPPAGNGLMTEREMSHVDRLQQGRKSGIGIEFQASTADGVLFISKVYEDSPADRSGVRPGDRVVAIDGTSLQGLALDGVLDLLQGEQGTPIGLTLVRGTSPALRIDVVLTRAIYDIPSVESRLIDDTMGYVRLSQFHGRTAEEARVELATLTAAGVGGIVLDLRGNQGGLLTAVHDVASLLLQDGSVVALLEDARGRDRQVLATGPPAYTGPLVCVVNRWTTAGAEALAATLQENDRAVLVGEATFGKGSTQSLYEVAPGLSLRLTSTGLLSPLGRSWDIAGLTPDYLVQGGPVRFPAGTGSTWPSTDVQISFATELLHADDVR